MIQSADLSQYLPSFPGREDDGKFELGIGPNQLQLRWPRSTKSFFPEEFNGAQALA